MLRPWIILTPGATINLILERIVKINCIFHEDTSIAIQSCLRMQSTAYRTQSHYAERFPTIIYPSGGDKWQRVKSPDKIGGKLSVAEVELAQRKTDAQGKVNGRIKQIRAVLEDLRGSPQRTYKARALNHPKDIDKRQEAERKREWGAKHPGQVYHKVLKQYFRTSYKQRTVATIPRLATLLQRTDDMDLTRSHYTKILTIVSQSKESRLTEFEARERTVFLCICCVLNGDWTRPSESGIVNLPNVRITRLPDTDLP